MKRLAIILAAVLSAAALAYIPSWGEDDIGQMQIRELEGDVLLSRAGDEIPVDGEASLKPGDEIILVDGIGFAELRLAGERRAELGEDARVRVVTEASLEIKSGSVKGATDGDQISVLLDGVTLENSSQTSTFRVDGGFGFARMAVYDGAVSLSRPGSESLSLPALFEASVTGGELPLEISPYRFDESDRWDQKELAAVITLDQDLEKTAAALSGQLGATRPNLNYFRELSGGDVSFMKPYLKRRVADLLIAYSIAENADALGLRPAFTTAFDYHDDKGPWGIIAAILQARANPLLVDLSDIVLATGVAQGDGGTEVLDFSLAAANDANDGGPDPNGSDNDGGGDNNNDGNGGNDGGNDDDPGDPDPPDDCEDGGDCTVDEITDQLPCVTECDPSPGPDGGSSSEDGDGDLTDGLLGGGGGGRQMTYAGVPRLK